MSNRIRIGIFWMLVQGLAGCGGDPSVLPTAPTSTPPASTPPAAVAWTNPFLVPGERWNLTTTTTSVTGPEGCVSPAALAGVGHSNEWLMAVERSGDAMHVAILYLPDFDDFYEYVGTLAGDEFSVSSQTPGVTLCGGARFNYQGVTQVSGRFSPDHRTLTAQEVDTYVSAAGTVTWSFGWSATRQ